MKLLKHIEHLIKASAGRYCLIHGSKITTGRAARKLEVQLGVPTVKKNAKCLSSSFRSNTMCTYVTSWPSQLFKLRVNHYKKSLLRYLFIL